MLFTLSPKDFANDINTEIGVIFATTAKDFVGIQRPWMGMVFKDVDHICREGPAYAHTEQLKNFLDKNKNAEHIAFVCAQGVSRSSAALLFAMRYLCASTDEDIQAAYKALYNIVPNKLFLSFLDNYLSNPLEPIIKQLPKGTKLKKNKKITLEVVDRHG